MITAINVAAAYDLLFCNTFARQYGLGLHEVQTITKEYAHKHQATDFGIDFVKPEELEGTIYGYNFCYQASDPGPGLCVVRLDKGDVITHTGELFPRYRVTPSEGRHTVFPAFFAGFQAIGADVIRPTIWVPSARAFAMFPAETWTPLFEASILAHINEAPLMFIEDTLLGEQKRPR